MEQRLKEYRNKVKRRNFAQRMKQVFSWNLANIGTGTSTDEHIIQIGQIQGQQTTPLLSDCEVSDEAVSPVISSDDESDNIGADKHSLYSRFTRTSLIVMSFVLWLVVFMIFIQLEFAIIYLIVSALVGIYVNTRTGPKAPGEISAYSVFNKNCERIDGTVTAEQLQSQMLAGPLGALNAVF